jgi:hypothetical protein
MAKDSTMAGSGAGVYRTKVEPDPEADLPTAAYCVGASRPLVSHQAEDRGADIRIVSWTLAGQGSATIIDDALRGVSAIAQESLVILTGGAPRDMADLVLQDEWRDRIRGHHWRWRDDFGAARTAALSLADESGADWSVMIDTDERVICPDPDVFRVWLAALPDRVQVALAHFADGSHTRERFFRHPCKHKFIGRSHESFTATLDEQAIIPRELIQWTELPKSADALRSKFERDVEMLRADIADNAKDGRAWFYLGQTLQALGRFEEAIEALREFHKLDTWEGGAWGCYRAAECYLALGQPDRAIDCALAGMARDAGIAELPWIAAVASLQVGRLEQARCWAELARVHGMGSEAERRRVGFRLPRGLTTGPSEVLEALTTALPSPVLCANCTGVIPDVTLRRRAKDGVSWWCADCADIPADTVTG